MTTAWAVETPLLTALLGRGWAFLPVGDDGRLRELYGAYLWPDHWIDTIRITSDTSAEARRADPYDGVVWTTDGTFTDVAERVLDLPPPGHRTAPRLVIATTMPRPWK